MLKQNCTSNSKSYCVSCSSSHPSVPGSSNKLLCRKPFCLLEISSVHLSIVSKKQVFIRKMQKQCSVELASLPASGLQMLISSDSFLYDGRFPVSIPYVLMQQKVSQVLSSLTFFPKMQQLTSPALDWQLLPSII